MVEGTQAVWQPIHYFARLGTPDRDGLVAAIKKMAASENRKKRFVDRALGKTSAYQKTPTKAVTSRKKIEVGEALPPKTTQEAAITASAIAGLSKRPSYEIAPLLALLVASHELVKERPTGGPMSAVRRAICRVDELYFGAVAN